MPEQKAVLLQEKDRSLVVGSRPIPKPGRGELLVKIKAAGLNPGDAKIQELGAPFLKDYPLVLGSDIAGDVVEVGEDVDAAKWPKGTRVFTEGNLLDSNFTAYQQYALVAEDLTVKIPANLSYSQAASLPVAFVFPAYVLFAEKPLGAGLNPSFDPKVKFEGQHALVIGGGSSVGQYSIQLLRRVLGFSSVVAYASPKHTEYLKSLGATHVIDRHQVSLQNIGSSITEITGISQPSLNIIIDAIGSEEAQQVGFSLLAEGGQLATTYPFFEERNEGGRRAFAVLGIVHPPTHRAIGIEIMKNLGKWLEEGVIEPNVIHDLDPGLENIIEGLKIVGEGRSNGKKFVGHPEES